MANHSTTSLQLTDDQREELNRHFHSVSEEQRSVGTCVFVAIIMLDLVAPSGRHRCHRCHHTHLFATDVFHIEAVPFNYLDILHL